MKFSILPYPADTQPNRALLIFAGWGMDAHPFEGLSAGGYRIIVIYDYTEAEFAPQLDEMLGTYVEIAVMAWSFGVPAAAAFIATHPHLPITARIAINGTMHPVSDDKGIPESIFRGTLDGLCENTLSKFHLRMCGSAAAFSRFAEHKPQRNISGLRDELEAIGRRTKQKYSGTESNDFKTDSVGSVSENHSRQLPLWDCAVISAADRIIPSSNQLHAWADGGEALDTIEIDVAHLPDFQQLIDLFISDKSRVAVNFARAKATYDTNASVQRDIVVRLCDFLPENAHQALEIGSGTMLGTRVLLERCRIDRLTLWDLSLAHDTIPEKHATSIVSEECDAETRIFTVPDESIDLIFSASTVQWFNSLPAFMRQVARVLRHGGEAVISTFGPDTMREVRSSRRMYYPSVEALRRMMPQGCRMLALEEQRTVLCFPTPLEALRHMKLTGVNATGNGQGAEAIAALRNYPTEPSGKACVTYHPIYIHLRKD